MKRIIILLTVSVMAVFCASAMAVSVTYGTNPGEGLKDSGGTYLQNGDLVELRYAGADGVMGGLDDVVDATTTIGFGFKTDGEWWKPNVTVNRPAGNKLYIRAYDAPTVGGATESQSSILYTVPSQASMTCIWQIPEPSLMLIYGAGLLLLKKKK